MVVVGAGVAGLCTALYAARRGLDVTVVERDGPERFTTSFGNAGLLTPSHFVPLAAPGVVGQGLRWMRDPESPFYIRPRLNPDLARWGWWFWRTGSAAHVERAAPVLRDLNLASRALFADLARERDDFGLVLRGGLMVCKTPHALDEEAAVARHARRLGLEAELLDADALVRMEPDARIAAAGAVFYPQDGYLDPARFMASVAARAEEAGAQFRWHTDVAGWDAAPGRVEAIRTGEGRIEADTFVVAAGAWTTALVRPLRLRLPMQAGKGYHLNLPAERLRLRLRHSLILVEGRVAVTPMGETVRFAGTMEIAGLDPAVNPARIRGITKTVPQYLPDVPAATFAGAKPWVGLRPLSPDGLPYVGPFRRFPNLFAATGHAMMGLSLGPVTGEAVAALAAGEAPPLPLAALSPDRFR
ncbi:MAG TPA: FAD-dependent oxidoreductase [Rubricoccaceae bacterium]|nr:FAD-dependent oxidoreductase [Rubricoccaceae bacterium]